MKKVAIVTVAVLALGLAACNKSDAGNNAATNDSINAADNALNATGNAVENAGNAVDNAASNATH